MTEEHSCGSVFPFHANRSKTSQRLSIVHHGGRSRRSCAPLAVCHGDPMAGMARTSDVHDFNHRHVHVSNPASSRRLCYLNDDADVCFAERAGTRFSSSCRRMRVRNRTRYFEGLGALANFLQWRPNGNQRGIGQFGLPTAWWLATYPGSRVLSLAFHTCFSSPSSSQQLLRYFILW